MSNSYSNYWEEEREREEGGKKKRGKEKKGERREERRSESWRGDIHVEGVLMSVWIGSGSPHKIP